MIDFEYPWFFLLLLPYAMILFYAWRKKEPSFTVPSLTAFRNTAGRPSADWRKGIPFLCFALAGACLVTGLARPRKGLELIRSRADGIDIILAVDLSGSMHAMDVPGHIAENRIASMIRQGDLKNRLETAKEEIAKFITERPNDRIGLVAFADRPFVVCPPTLDHAFLLANLNRMEPGMIGDGTGIAGPVASAVKRLKESDAKSRIVVLFTDGANTVPQQITPKEAAKLADTFQITVYTVGIGSDNSFMEQPTLFGSKQLVRYAGQYDEDLLREIASITGGRFYRAADASGMAEAMKRINELEKTGADQPVLMRWKEFYPVAAWCAIAFLLLGLLLRNTVCLKYP